LGIYNGNIFWWNFSWDESSLKCDFEGIWWVGATFCGLVEKIFCIFLLIFYSILLNSCPILFSFDHFWSIFIDSFAKFLSNFTKILFIFTDFLINFCSIFISLFSILLSFCSCLLRFAQFWKIIYQFYLTFINIFN